MMLDKGGYGFRSLVELVAAVAGISQGKAQSVLYAINGDLARLMSFSASGLGITDRQMIRLLRALELGRKSVYLEGDEPTRIDSPLDVAGFLHHRMAHLEQENVVLICLNTRNFILDVRTCYIGTINSACLKAGEIIRHVIQCNAASFILAHNHPSGDHSPSPEDFAVTKVIHAASKLMEVAMLDHLIIGRSTHYSMAESGGLPGNGI